MTPWSDLEARLDAAAFALLSDDTVATWTRPGSFVVTVPAILDVVEAPGSFAGGALSIVEEAHVVRVSVAALKAVQPLAHPAAGDVFTVKGRVLVVHGRPWLDQRMNGRDWLCPVSGALTGSSVYP